MSVKFRVCLLLVFGCILVVTNLAVSLSRPPLPSGESAPLPAMSMEPACFAIVVLGGAALLSKRTCRRQERQPQQRRS